MENEEQMEEVQQEEAQQEVQQESQSEESATVKEEVDERGVPWKNVALEARRKMEALEEKLNRIEQTIPRPTFGQPVSQPKPVDPVEKVKKFAADPDAFFDEKYQKLRYQDRLRDAEMWLREQDPNNYLDTEKKVIDTMREYGIQNPDPLLAVKKAYGLIKKLTPSPKQTDSQRQELLKRKQTESGNRPPALAKKDKIVSDIRKKAVQSSSDADMRDFFNEAFGG